MSKTLPEEVKKKIVGILKILFPDAKIYLFGSRATGLAGEWSDIDIALDAGKKIDFEKVGEAKEVLAALSIPYKVDVVDLNSVYPEMQKSILKTRILWSK